MASFSDDNHDDKNQGGQNQNIEGGAPSSDDQSGDRVFLVVGDRAFRTKDDVANNITHAQTHISQIESENGDLRRTLAEREKELERLRLASEGMQQQSGTHQETGSQTAPLSKDELVSTITSVMRQAQSEEVKQSNLNACYDIAAKAYGDEMKTKVKEIAEGLGMTLKAVDEMAKTQPKAFNHLFIPKTSDKSADSHHEGDVNAEALQRQNQQNQQPASWSARGKSSKDIASEVARRLAAFND